MSGVVTGTPETRTVNIDSDLSDKEFYAVSIVDAVEDTVNLLAAATAIPFILAEGGDGSTTATLGTIVTGGRSKVKLGGTVAAGDKLTATTGGKWIATTTENDNFGAIAEKAGVANDIIAVTVTQGTVGA